MFWGLSLLFLLSVLSGLAVEILPAFGYQPGISWFIDMLADMDNRWTALFNDGLNMIITLGIVLALIKGFVQKKKIKMFEMLDVFLICFIGFILVSGWFTEASRFLAEETPYYIAKFGFIGYWLSIIMKLIAPSTSPEVWNIWHTTWWHIHITTVWLSFLYIPFSKLSHVIFSSVAASVNGLEKRIKIKELLNGEN
jgi:nitrate reductase gamma subunit